MKLIDFFLIGLIFDIVIFVYCSEQLKKPTVLIAILVRNKAHTLPYFLSYLERQDYPKDRIRLWIRSDRNIDNTNEILDAWLKGVVAKYHAINLHTDNSSSQFEDEQSIAHWSALRFAHVISLREEALNYARNLWADYIWMLDADIFMANPNTLNNLISKEQAVVAPLLVSDGMYSNFWAGMTADYYYLRTDEYKPILYRETIGCFNVPMIHSAVLINLKTINSDNLTYDANNLAEYHGPIDDIIIFANGANISGVSLYICNDELYGYIMVPLEKDETVTEDLQRLTNIKIEILSHEGDFPLSKSMSAFVAHSNENHLNVDNIYMINLLRRPERRARMYRLFKEFGIQVEAIDAVDGRVLNDSVLEKLGVNMMPEYTDPYHKRLMTMGEIGCFLSHYIIWNKVLEQDYERVIVLEDDIRFEPFFLQKLRVILAELDELSTNWDLIYLGRKKLTENEEARVQNSHYLVHAAYSYWTLGYILSINGAKKLVEALPLEKIVPVDEYIPILSDMHPRNNWKKHYSTRNLIVMSAHPLLIHPTHYIGEHGYVSDTEDSNILANDTSKLHNREDL